MKFDIQQEFKNGRQDRIRSPLPHGLYKLKEARRYPDRVLDTLKQLVEARECRQPIEYILYGDSPRVWARVWIKSLAYRVGKDLLPSIEALTGNGIPAPIIQREMPRLKQREAALLDALQHADWQLKSEGANYEYNLWGRGKSVLIEPCLEFLSITEVGLRLVDIHLPSELSDDERDEFFSLDKRVVMTKRATLSTGQR